MPVPSPIGPAAPHALATSAKVPAVAAVEPLPFLKVGGGKVRELYDLGDAYLMIATDRLSAFDVVLPDPIPGKGIILTEISRLWFRRLEALGPHHLLPDHEARRAALFPDRPGLAARSLVVRKLRPLPVEAVVRGYLAGSAWKDYRRTGAVFGQAVPSGLRESDRLPVPLFTPTTKAGRGQHDEPMAPGALEALLGAPLARRVEAFSLDLYRRAAEIAAPAGILLADTKFEFGLDERGEVVLMDEVLTPDSSRWWPADTFRPGGPQPSFDKQFVRDYLETLEGWDKTPPGPSLPGPVIEGTRRRYLEAWERLAEAVGEPLR